MHFSPAPLKGAFYLRRGQQMKHIGSAGSILLMETWREIYVPQALTQNKLIICFSDVGGEINTGHAIGIESSVS